MAKSRDIGGSNFNPLKCNPLHVVWVKWNNFSETHCHKLSIMIIAEYPWEGMVARSDLAMDSRCGSKQAV